MLVYTSNLSTLPISLVYETRKLFQHTLEKDLLPVNTIIPYRRSIDGFRYTFGCHVLRLNDFRGNV